MIDHSCSVSGTLSPEVKVIPPSEPKQAFLINHIVSLEYPERIKAYKDTVIRKAGYLKSYNLPEVAQGPVLKTFGMCR